MTHKFAKCCFALLTAVGLALTTSIACAQTVTGSIRGTVTDATGAVVAEAKVTATNSNTGVATVTTTDRTGTYNLQSLPIGSYVVSAEKAGFNITADRPFALEIDQIAKIDLKLQVGEVTTTIEVAPDSGAILQSEDASLGTTITANTLENIPLSGQNFSSATMFVPGAVLPTYSAGKDPGNRARHVLRASTQPSFNGNRMQTNNYILDGADINEPLKNVIAYNPAPEAMARCASSLVTPTPNMATSTAAKSSW